MVILPFFQIIIAECAEPRFRGYFISIPFVSYAAGILLTYSLGAFLNWRTVAWCCTILPIVSLVALYLIPETPVSSDRSICSILSVIYRKSFVAQGVVGEGKTLQTSRGVTDMVKVQ